MSTYRSVLDTLAQRFDFRVIPTWRLKEWHAARRVSTLLHALEIDCVIDVGANRGQFRNFLRAEVGYAGQVCSFEPQMARCIELQPRVKADPHWTLTRAAIGRQPGTLPLRVTAQDMFSSLLPQRTDAVAKMTGYNTTERVEEVPVLTLRDLWPGIRRDHSRAFLKIDTQGYDLEVLAGAGRALEDCPLIQTELSVQPLYEGAPDYRDAIEALTSLGYELAGVHPVSTDGVRLVEMDGLFVRKGAPA